MKAPSTKPDEFEQVLEDWLDLERFKEHWDFDVEACKIRLESATRGPPAQASYLLTVTPKQCNLLGNLHGGCAATIIDVMSTHILVAISKPGTFSLGGVSRHLNMTYLRPVPMGTEIRLVCKVVQSGRRLALLEAEIYRVDTGALCMIGKHDKANTDPKVGAKI